jgi:hypothetical protein
MQLTNRILIPLVVLLLAGCSSKNEKKLVVQEIDSPASSPSAEPYLFTADDGSVLLSWIEKQDKKSQFKFSRFENNSWTAPMLIDSGRTWFVNWADYPMIAANGKDFIAHYLDKSGDGTFSYDVKITTSSNEGKTWTRASILHDDGKQAEHGFVSLLPFGDNFFVAWLDGRNTVMEGMEDMENMDHGHHGQMSLRGAVLDKTGKKLNEWELDNRTCDCCQTAAALTDNGPVVVYRDRSDEEIRDMSIVRYENGAWTAPESIFPDNWKIEGCPVNGPRIVSRGNRLAIAWYSMPDGKAQVNVTFSEDGGKTFGKPVQVDEGASIGRVDITMLEGNEVFVTWMEGSTIKGVIVSDKGKQSSVAIGSSTESRSSGFPQVTRSGNQLIFAWTDDKEKVVKTAFMNL